MSEKHCAATATPGAIEPRRLATPLGIELWLVNLQGQPSPAMLAWLSPSERAKASRFVFARDRRRYEAAHTALRQLLAPRAGAAPQDLRFLEGRFGKPALCPPCDCVFNLSHSEDEAAVLIAADGDIGVDIELLHCVPDALALAQRFFSAEECAALADVDMASRSLAFLTGWTRKEACLKAIGSGLSIAPDTFTAGLAHDARRTVIRTPQGLAEVGVKSSLHDQHLVVAWARVEGMLHD